MYQQTISKMKSMPRLNEERLYEGLRIPSDLDTQAPVNFVLTQEPGKLKPKDLKLAIERNRAEKKMRAEEQKKIREEGGGAGTLDLRGILAEERMNSASSDPFKRQLREMAFLADVDDVEKQEIEKGFRISEDYLGSNILSADDVSAIYYQRSVALLHKKRTEWRTVQSRQITAMYPPTHAYVKGGASAETALQIIRTVNPKFDPNRNDIWGKRINTLRRFVSLVSRWLNQRRVKRRMDRLVDTFLAHGASNREEVRAYIEAENETNRKQGSSSSGGDTKKNAPQAVKFDADALNDTMVKAKPSSLAVMLLEKPNEQLTRREYQESIIATANAKSADETISFDMVRRVLFPQSASESGAGQTKQELPPVSMDQPIAFDDRTIFQLKVKPQFVTLGFTTHQPPTVPTHYPTCSEKLLRVGAPEEVALRPAADGEANLEEVGQWLSPPADEPDVIADLRAQGQAIRIAEVANFFRKENEDGHVVEVVKSSSAAISMPSWMTAEASWSQKDVNLINPVSDTRNYARALRRCELDNDWINRPSSETLTYIADSSLRTKWSSKTGFLSANTYLLGAHEARNKDLPPPPGPTLCDLYLPDSDRHASGLFCYNKDHLRGVVEKDPDVAPLQAKQSKHDYLTDSESDDEDGYNDFKPSMKRVRQILKAPPAPKAVEAAPPVDAGKKGTKGAPAAPAAPAVVSPRKDADFEDDEPLLSEAQKKEEQVELLRDRKVLDWQSTITKARKSKFDAINEKLVELSKHTKCPVQAIPVQLPFHQYEDDVYKTVAVRTGDISTTHVEMNPRSSVQSLNGMGSAFNSPMKSPNPRSGSDKGNDKD